MARVRWSSVAARQIDDILEELGALSPSAAARLANRVREATRLLEEYPSLGRVVSAFQHRAVRELFVEKYRLVYRVEREDVLILTVIHGSRNLLRHMPAGPWDIE